MSRCRVHTLAPTFIAPFVLCNQTVLLTALCRTVQNSMCNICQLFQFGKYSVVVPINRPIQCEEHCANSSQPRSNHVLLHSPRRYHLNINLLSLSMQHATPTCSHVCQHRHRMLESLCRYATSPRRKRRRTLLDCMSVAFKVVEIPSDTAGRHRQT